MRLDLLDLLAPAPIDPLWEAEKSGWRCIVFGNVDCCFRRDSRLAAAWERGFAAAGRSSDPVGLML